MEENTGMHRYIEETARQCRENVAKAGELTRAAVELFRQKDYRHVVILASGSSYNASVTAIPFVEEVLGVKCSVYSSYTFANYGRIYEKDTFVFGAGQSGRSTNTNAALDKVRTMGCAAVGVTAEVESEMKNHCDVICSWGVGVEKNPCVTKGYTTLVLYYMLFAVEAARATGRITPAQADGWLDKLNEACGVMENMVDEADAWYERNEGELTAMKRIQVLGCGAGYGTAIEGALKMAETVCIPSNAYEQEEYLHGHCYEAGEAYSVFVIDSKGPSSDRAVQLYKALHHLTEKAYLITHREMDDPRVVGVPHDLPDVITPLVNTIPFQIVASHAREKRVMHPGIRKLNDELTTKTPRTGSEKGF